MVAAPGSAGHFLAVNESEQPRFLRLGAAPQKLSNDYAVSETQASARIITRGTVDPNDDVSVLPGQAWVTVSSPVEGSSYVTAYAPDIQGTLGNRQSTVIHWVDARWIAPSSTTAPAGEKVALVTRVMRASTGVPLPGYKVRYEFAGGADSGFGPTLAGGVELTTNEEGLTSAELAARNVAAGATQVNVQLIRPTGVAPGANETLVLGNTTITIAWTGPAAIVAPLPGSALPGGELTTGVPPPTQRGSESGAVPGALNGLEVRVKGPSQPVTVGGQAEFQIDITNRASAALTNVVVLDRFGSGLQHAVAPSPIRRSIGTIGPSETKSIGLTFTVREAGRQCHTLEVTADGGFTATAEGCVVGNPPAEAPAAVERRAPLSVRLSEPMQPVSAGAEFHCRITVGNDGTSPQRNVVFSVEVPDSLRLQSIQGPAKYVQSGTTLRFEPVLLLEPGKLVVYDLVFKAARSGSAVILATATSQAITEPVTIQQAIQVSGTN